MNSGAPKRATDAEVGFDFRGLMVRIHAEDRDSGGPMSRKDEATYGLTRSVG